MEGSASKGADQTCRTISPIFKKGIETTAFLFVIAIFVGTFIASRWINTSTFAGSSVEQAISAFRNSVADLEKITYSLNCSRRDDAQTCSSYFPTTHRFATSSPEACPHYFHWIHEDLRPWKSTGITKEMVEQAKRAASVRIVIINGRVYMKRYRYVFQTRDVFTIWGILQLLRLYPGEIPDLDLVYQMDDRPSMKKRDYSGAKSKKMPPLFHFCADRSTFDIIFPDWSFWGWPEINIEPWNVLKKELDEGNKREEWIKRVPYAYWKGNLNTGGRHDLKDCNITDEHDWNARIFDVNWGDESQRRFKGTNLSNQCDYRYKIYIEGNAWSVSEKYVLGCGSMSLFIQPEYYDFFSRSLLPTVHYWPIHKGNTCKSIKFAVDWGNNNTEKAQKIAMAGSKYMQEDLAMKNVYDYMFHLLRGYGELLRFKPEVPQGAVEMCMETMACKAPRLEKKFMVESMVRSPSDTRPCSMPPPFSPRELQLFLERRDKLTKQVEMWENFGHA